MCALTARPNKGDWYLYICSPTLSTLTPLERFNKLDECGPHIAIALLFFSFQCHCISSLSKNDHYSVCET